MALKSILDNLDGLDPSLQEHYTEKDGKFYLDIEDDIRRHPKGASLQVAIDRLKTEKRTLTDKLAEVEAKIAELPDEFDAEKFAADMDELEELRQKQSGNNPPDEGQRQQQKQLYEQRIANLETKHQNERQRLESEKQSLEDQIKKIMGDDGLTKALISVGVDKKLLPGATALLRRSVKVERDPDTGEWRSVVETDVGESSIDEFVSNWAQSDEGDIYVQKPSGGGAEGQNGQRFAFNPFAKDTRNLTKQQELIASNPEKARQMAQAAGEPVNW